MKRRKYMAVVMAGLFALAMPITGYAEEKSNVWIEEAESEGQVLSVDVKTDGKTTDGLLVISYDTAVLQVEEEDVVWADEVEMYSVNITEDGTLKVAYLSENTIETDRLATIKFTMNEENVSLDMITIEGEVYDSDGNPLTVGKKETETDGGKKPLEENEKQTESSEKAVETGDIRRTGLWTFAFLTASGIASGIVLNKRKHGRG